MVKQTVREQVAELELAVKRVQSLAKKLDRRLERRQDKADSTDDFDDFHYDWEKCGNVVYSLEEAVENVKDLKKAVRRAKD